MTTQGEPAAASETEVEERVSEESLARAYWPLWVLPVTGVATSLFVASYLPGSVNDFYFDIVFPFGLTAWLGAFIAYGWQVQRLWIQEIPRRWAPYAVAGAVTFVVFIMGGPGAIVDDPWMAGMLLVPGVRMFLAYQRRTQGSHATGNE